MNIMVTGATGFIGSHLCRELINKGHHVLALSYSGKTNNINSLLPLKEFHLQRGNIRDADMVHDIIKNHQIKAVFHLAAKLPGDDDIHNPFLCFDTNARGTLMC